MLYCLPELFREFFQFFQKKYKSMGENEPQDKANLDPRAMVGNIFVGDAPNIAIYT